MNILTPPTTPPTTPDGCDGQSPLLDLITFGRYSEIEFRGVKTEEGIKIKVVDLLTYFKLNIAYMRTVVPYLVSYSLSDLYRHDFYNITGVCDSHRDPTLFSDYADSHELYIMYKGLVILAHNIPVLSPFRDWLDSVLEIDLKCYEKINYDDIESFY